MTLPSMMTMKVKREWRSTDIPVNSFATFLTRLTFIILLVVVTGLMYLFVLRLAMKRLAAEHHSEGTKP